MNYMNELSILKRENKLLKEQRQASITLLKQLDKEVGLHWGSEIAKHVALLNGSRFSEADWVEQDLNGEQGR